MKVVLLETVTLSVLRSSNKPDWTNVCLYTAAMTTVTPRNAAAVKIG